MGRTRHIQLPKYYRTQQHGNPYKPRAASSQCRAARSPSSLPASSFLFLSLSYRSKHELGANEFKASTRAYFVEVIAKLVARGAKAIVLGCTEIELLELESHVADGTKLYRSALLHCDCVAQILSGSLTPEDLVPALEITTPE